MEKQYLAIGGIPAVLWGPVSDKLYIAIHGDSSNKEGDVINVFAEEAVKKGCRVLSFDLPQHGERKEESRPLTPKSAIADLNKIMKHARSIAGEIGLFGVSIGAYFGMLAFSDERLFQALFLSPVVDMARIIENMMEWFGVSEERLQREGEIATQEKTLSWDYYTFVKENPITWNKQTALLYGSKDELCEFDVVNAFARRVGADLTIMEGAEHFFHTEGQLAFLRQWLIARIV